MTRMCANYTPATREQLREHFHVAPPDDAFAAEAFPGSQGPIIRLRHEATQSGQMEAVTACFGMVPHWADMKLARSTYNARTETVASKPSFRHAYRHRQFCVIPVAAIYEPNYETGKAVRWKIASTDGRPLGLAGIWEYRADGPEGAGLTSFSMLTMNADGHPLMQRFHKPDDEKRMVVVLEPEQYESWLHASLAQAPGFFVPYPASGLSATPAPLQRASRSPPPSTASLFPG
jgi:putative SOS response-associated peptidase YedK